MDAAQSGTLERLMRWYADQCDGEWEHVDGVTVETLDNPGWHLRVQTRATTRPLVDFDWRKALPDTDADWLHHRVEGGTFDAFGDPGKLGAMLSLFLDLVERGRH